MTYKLPFGIDFVVEQDLVPLGIRKFKAARGYSFNCPFCAYRTHSADTRHKYTVDLNKNTGHCCRCGAGHGVLSLHAELTGLSKEEARADLFRRYNGLTSEAKVELQKMSLEQAKRQEETLIPADYRIRDTVYRRLLNSLTLSKKHHDDLLRRGLSEEAIEKGMYRSVPVIGFSTLAKICQTREVREYFEKYPDHGVAGFVDMATEDPRLVQCKAGYFIPLLDIYGNISGMQVRFDPLPDEASAYEIENYARYKWFSSSGIKGGCGIENIWNIHCANVCPGAKSVIITEGVLKADVTSYLYGLLENKDPVPVMGIVGINNHAQLEWDLKSLKDAGLEKVYVAMDMDRMFNPAVEKQTEEIIKKVKGCSLDCELIEWNPQKGKGIDDYLLTLCEQRSLL